MENREAKKGETDMKKLRKHWQNMNDEFVIQSLEKGEIDKKHINIKAYERVKEKTGTHCTTKDLLQKCKNDIIFRQVLAMYIAKNATRQNKGEDWQFDMLKKTSKQYGIVITRLRNSTYRPHKNGKIVKNKDENCLKSFDARISGNMNGYIIAKCVLALEDTKIM
jgi:hypothetical protein